MTKCCFRTKGFTLGAFGAVRQGASGAHGGRDMTKCSGLGAFGADAYGDQGRDMTFDQMLLSASRVEHLVMFPLGRLRRRALGRLRRPRGRGT